MITINEFDEKAFRKLVVSLGKAAIGQRVSFVFEEGMHRLEDEGKVFEQPNGTATFRLFINGGAQDSGVPEKKADDQSAVRGGSGVSGEPVATLIPALAANCD